MFRKAGTTEKAGAVYCCQEDGMLGLGAGARSYTSKLHYSSRFAVHRSGVTEIIKSYIDSFDSSKDIDYGFRLDQEDQRRRYLILSLLSTEGLMFESYKFRFNENPFIDFPELYQLIEFGYATSAKEGMLLTDKGLEHSDSIGPWLYSDKVNRLINECEVQ